jgi:hypothetical protein
MAIERIRWIPTGTTEGNRVLEYAARELGRYVRRLTGERWDVKPIRSAATVEGTAYLSLCDQLLLPPGIELAPAPWDDGFTVWAQDGGLFIAGRNPRSVLFGVYAFLERQGVRYLRPGDDGEVVPQVDALQLPAAPIVEKAAYRHRGLCIEGAPSVTHALGVIDWCAKKRMNTIFLQFLSSRYFYSRWYERPYNAQFAEEPVSEQEALAYDDQLIDSMKQRGLILHRVGHGWTSAAFGMPRSGWVVSDEPVPAQYQRWLAEVDGERKLFGGIPINTELCYSHQPAFDGLIDTVVHYCEDHPELDVVHVWLSDATNNKCECADCRKLSISDWYAKIINALSEQLHQRVPGVRFVFLAYNELLWPPEEVTIDEQAGATGEDGNAILMFAPIARCYGHALVDPACNDGEEWPRPPLNEYAVSRQNAFYVRRLAAWRKAFAGDSFDFDYHLMWANWHQLTDTHLAWLLYADLQDLGALGLNGLISCQAFRAFYPSGLAMSALSEALWNPDVPWDEMRRRYLDAAFGEHADFADAYLRTLESFLDTGDPEWRTTPLSVLDPHQLVTCADFLATSLSEMALRRESTVGRAHDRSLDLLSHHARFLQFLVQAYRARHAGRPVEAERALDTAADFLRNTEPDYSTFIDTQLALRAVDAARRTI